MSGLCCTCSKHKTPTLYTHLLGNTHISITQTTKKIHQNTYTLHMHHSLQLYSNHDFCLTNKNNHNAYVPVFCALTNFCIHTGWSAPFFFVLYKLILNVSLNNLSVMFGRVFLDWTHTKQGLICLAQGHNAVMPVRLEPADLQSLVKHSTTEPLTSSRPLLFAYLEV